MASALLVTTDDWVDVACATEDVVVSGGDDVEVVEVDGGGEEVDDVVMKVDDVVSIDVEVEVDVDVEVEVDEDEEEEEDEEDEEEELLSSPSSLLDVLAEKVFTVALSCAF